MAAYDSGTIETMCIALDEAWHEIPSNMQTGTLHAKMATRVVRAAENGERDPKRLKEAALGDTRTLNVFEHLASLARQVSSESFRTKE